MENCIARAEEGIYILLSNQILLKENPYGRVFEGFW